MGVLFVKQLMVINEEPSLIKRLRVGTLKMLKASLHTVRLYTTKYAYFVLTGVTFMIAGSFFVFNHSTEAIGDEMPIADQELQQYTACVFSKSLMDTDANQGITVGIDEECKKASANDVFVETEEDWFEQELNDMLAGHPMEIMAGSIAQQDKKVAGLIVGIARQESQWGMHAPSKGGVDCYNYWGYKSTGTRGQSMGYACFGSPQEAVEVVAKRLDHFVYDAHRDTPAKMVTPWKCGNSCASHSPESVQRWVGTVSTYFNQIVALDVQDTQIQNTLLSFNK